MTTHLNRVLAISFLSDVQRKNFTGMVAGTYNAIITATASGSTISPWQIPVSLILSAAAADTATLTCNDQHRIRSGAHPPATTPKTTSYVARGLRNGTTYFVVITAYDSSGNESTFSNEVSKSIF
jgi:hypothetical protein